LETVEGIFMWRDGIITKIIDIDDTLDGRALYGFHVGPDAISGNNIVFHVQFSSDQGPRYTYEEAIYVASIPEPATGMLLAGAVTMFGLRRRPHFA
ncbi:MAG TPA: PEP-CTERM sorting domain-containing protein, partial [Tepidisphaeraceae bacterium]|nr:PEP-CTERM sorting domain-containing protein [Tepidisphaeraceae bacterium]